MQRYEEDDLETLGYVALSLLVILALVFVALLAIVLWIGWS